MHFILLTMLLFIKLFCYEERVVSLFTKYLLCICEQLDNSDLFKGHGLASPGGGVGAYGLSYSEGGLPQMGDKSPELGGIQKCVDTMKCK